MRHYLLLLFCLAVTYFSGCTPDEVDEANPLGFIVPREDFTLENDRTYDLVPADGAVSNLVGVGEFLYYATYQKEIYALNTRTEEKTLLIDEVQTWEIEAVDSEVYFCTSQGLYRVDVRAPLELLQLADACYNVEILPDETIYFTTLSSANIGYPNQVYTPEEDTVKAFSAPLPSLIGKFEVLPNGELMVFSSSPSNMIYRLTPDGTILQTWDQTSSPLFEYNIWDRQWLVTTDDGLIVVAKNGYGYPQILQWSTETETWSDLLIDQVIEDNISIEDVKLSYLRKPSYTDAQFFNGYLYITTTLAGCLGMHRFDLNGSTPFAYGDFKVIQDERLGPFQCLEGMYYDEGGKALYIYTEQQVVVFN